VSTVRYLPMMRSKAGDAIALSHLAAGSRDRVLPVIHLTHLPATTFASAISSAWTGRPMALDGKFQCDMTGGTQVFNQMFDQIGRARVAVMPSIEYNSTAPYLAAVQKVRNRYAPGVLVQARPSQLHDVLDWCSAQSWTPAEVDLVINLADIGGYDAAMLTSIVSRAIVQHIPNPSPWRSITLCASAAPRDDSGLLPGYNLVPRLEWRIWRESVTGIPQLLDYADFLTAHPDLADPPRYAVTKTIVSARYTIENDWIVLKGNPITGETAHQMTIQYRNHAKTLVANPDFGGLYECWADDKIRKIADGAPGGGSRSVWTAIVASRHLSFVIDRLCAERRCVERV
jgi:hypothetical protein